VNIIATSSNPDKKQIAYNYLEKLAKSKHLWKHDKIWSILDKEIIVDPPTQFFNDAINILKWMLINSCRFQLFTRPTKATEVNHPDHTLITYPNLGHLFYPSSQWSTGIGPIQQYVLADLYAWLEAHSGFTRPASAVLSSYYSSPSSTNSTTK
jgi:hypothetical protein